MTAYDELAYGSHAFPQTHPRQLAAVAACHGLNPAPLARMTVLELGCGAGGNLLPMALAHPQARFVGIDLSRVAIEEAGRAAAELDLDNIMFRQADILDLPAAFGRFDYIIAHGVYSWVPAPVRERLLALYGALLAPQGVGFLSFNALPGSRLRDLGRDVMLFYSRGIADPRERVRVARESLTAVAEASDPDSIYGIVLRARLAELAETSDDVLFHDDLNDAAEAFSFHEVVTAAARHGVAFLADAAFPSLFGGARGGPKRFLDALPAEDHLLREQSLDLLLGRPFRQILLCRDDAGIRRGEAVDLGRFFLAAEVAEIPGREGDRPGAVHFRFGEVRLSLDLAPAIAAIRLLAAAWPAAIGHAELLSRTTEGGEADRQRLGEVLTALFRAGLLDFALDPPALAREPGEHPCVGPLARLQAARQSSATDQRHRNVALDDPALRHFVTLLDGTRDGEALAAAMRAFLASPEASAAGLPGPEGTDAALIRRHLDDVARLGLLIR